MADETTTTSTASETSTASSGANQPPTNADGNQAQVSPSKLAELERELQRVRSQQGREAADFRRQLADQQARTREVVTRNMPDEQRIVYERDEAIGFARSTQQQLEAIQLQQARTERISELSRKTGVPFEELDKAQSPDDLAELVADWKEKQLDNKVKQQVEKLSAKREANAVDLGGGGAARKDASSVDEQFKKALASGDVRQLARLKYALQEQQG